VGLDVWSSGDGVRRCPVKATERPGQRPLDGDGVFRFVVIVSNQRQNVDIEACLDV
jgi:hypothetical protein